MRVESSTNSPALDEYVNVYYSPIRGSSNQNNQVIPDHIEWCHPVESRKDKYRSKALDFFSFWHVGGNITNQTLWFNPPPHPVLSLDSRNTPNFIISIFSDFSGTEKLI